MCVIRPACFNAANALNFPRDLRRFIGRIAAKVWNSGRINAAEALRLYHSAAGGARRARRPPPPAREGEGFQRSRQRDRHLTTF